MPCVFYNNNMCSNPQSPIYKSECPLKDTSGLCQFEERFEQSSKTPKECFAAAIQLVEPIDIDSIDEMFKLFMQLMEQHNYCFAADAGDKNQKLLISVD